ncbi:unnamed protein product [Prunus armeniaca]
MLPWSLHRSSKEVGKVPEALSPQSTSKTKGKGKATLTTPKRRSMRILQTRFANTRKGKGEGSRPKVIVTVDDDDDGSDESGGVETGTSTHGQESIRGTSGTDKDLDEDQYYSCDEGTYPDFHTHLEEPDASNMPPKFASDHEQRVDVESVVPTVEDTASCSPEAGLGLLATVADTAQTIGKFDTTADTSPQLPAGSIDELLLLCHRFNGYVAFQCALVYPETVVVLRKFMDKYGSFMEITDITSSFSRSAAF